MIFVGEDGSVLTELDNGFHLEYPNHLPKGVKYSDISKHPSFSIIEALWCCKAHCTFIDALDICIVANGTMDRDRIEAIYLLHADHALSITLAKNISDMIAFNLFEQEKAFILISQAQKHLKLLHQSVEERENAIKSEVCDIDEGYFL